MRILVMGLSGSGKTTLADELQRLSRFPRINADKVRAEYNDWDFSNEGRLRQARRLKKLSEEDARSITDFIAPTEEIRKIFKADITIWMDTVSKSKYEDTDKVFEIPTTYDYRVTTKNVKKWALLIYKNAINSDKYVKKVIL
tara:strand:- start:1507 stop:1932 length:426 start_codon:yes stop_codon:yes gene_type:complete